MLKFFRTLFAETGDRTAIPDAVEPDGSVSYSEGYGFDYQRAKTDANAKDIEREKMNALFYDLTGAVSELQSQGIPDFITTVLNGGTAYAYAENAIVRFEGVNYVSLEDDNTATPADETKWAALPVPGRLPAFRARRTGTAQAFPSGAITMVHFNTEDFDLTAAYDTGSYTFTPLVPGIYQLSGAVTFGSPTAITGTPGARLGIYKNGAIDVEAGITRFSDGGVAAQSITFAAAVEANGVDDYFQIFVYHDTGLTDMEISYEGGVHFSGVKVA